MEKIRFTMENIKRNLGYQTLLQILNTCLPLITSPYLSRTLAANGLGIFSYTQSIVNYFTLFAMLGIINYGTREIAMCKTDKKKYSENFWNIYALQSVMSMLAIISYILYIIFVAKENIVVTWIQGIYIIATLFDVSWVYFGIENFATTVKISMLIRILSVVTILLLVNSTDDLWLYTLIMSGGVLLNNLLLWIHTFKVVDISEIKSIKINKIFSHVKPNIILFIPLLAMSIYHIMDKTMLGALSSYEQTGFYYNADKIINIPMGIITGIGTVMLPRVSSIIEAGKKETSDKLFKLSIEMIIVVSTAMFFGIASISEEFIPIFFGKGFETCIVLVIVLSPVLLIKGLSYTARMQYLIPNYKEKIFIESVFIGAFTNLFINIVLIVRIGAMGAVLGTVIAEFLSCFWQYFRMMKYIKCGKTILYSLIYLVFGMIMFLILSFIDNYIFNNILCIIIEILFGAIIYSGLCLVYWKITQNPILKIIFNKK